MLTQLTNNKKVQRKELLAKRRALTLIQKNEYSAVITKKLVELEEYKNSQICFLYASPHAETLSVQRIWCPAFM